jgi:hypothetical protein
VNIIDDDYILNFDTSQLSVSSGIARGRSGWVLGGIPAGTGEL